MDTTGIKILTETKFHGVRTRGCRERQFVAGEIGVHGNTDANGSTIQLDIACGAILDIHYRYLLVRMGPEEARELATKLNNAAATAESAERVFFTEGRHG